MILMHATYFWNEGLKNPYQTIARWSADAQFLVTAGDYRAGERQEGERGGG